MSKADSEKIRKTGRRIIEFRARFDPDVNDYAPFHLALYMREQGRIVEAWMQTIKLLDIQKFAQLAAPLYMLILAEDMDKPSEAIRFGMEFLKAPQNTSLDPQDLRTIVFVCAKHIVDIDSLKLFQQVVLKRLLDLTPNKNLETVFLDLMESMGAVKSQVLNSYPEGYQGQEKINDFGIEVTAKISERIGEWKSKGCFHDDDPLNDFISISQKNCKKILEYNYKLGMSRALDYIENVIENFQKILDKKDIAIEERIRQAYNCLQESYETDGGGEQDDQWSNRSHEILKTMLSLIAGSMEEEMNPGKQFEKPVEGIEATTRQQLTTAKLILDRLAGKDDVIFGLPVLALAVALEEEFKAKLLIPLGKAKKYGQINGLDVTTKTVCLKKADSKNPDTTCECYRKFLQKDESRFLFGHIAATWRVLTKPPKSCPELLDTITTWFAEKLADSPLLTETAAAVIEELGSLRNRAAHPGKKPIDEATAQRVYTICLEAFSEKDSVGLITAFGEIRNEATIHNA
jgi:hypothetical protein